MNTKNKKGLKIATYLTGTVLFFQAYGMERSQKIEHELRVNKLVTQQFYEKLTQAEAIDNPIIREKEINTCIACLQNVTLFEEELTQKLEEAQKREGILGEWHRIRIEKRANEVKINQYIGIARDY